MRKTVKLPLYLSEFWSCHSSLSTVACFNITYAVLFWPTKVVMMLFSAPKSRSGIKLMLHILSLRQLFVKHAENTPKKIFSQNIKHSFYTRIVYKYYWLLDGAIFKMASCPSLSARGRPCANLFWATGCMRRSTSAGAINNDGGQVECRKYHGSHISIISQFNPCN